MHSTASQTSESNRNIPTDRPITAFDLMDGMRALAAMAVMFSHERNILFLDATAGLAAPWKFFYFVTGFGHEAVMIFFVLSGYWITKTVARRSSEGPFAWLDYAIDRLSRLWVVLIPALLIGSIFDVIGRFQIIAPIYLGIQGTNSLTWDVSTRLSLSNLAGNLLFLQTLLVKPFGSNAPLWSLANEFWYYVWFPPLFQLVRKQRQSIVASLLVLITMITFRNLLPGFVCWLFGSLLFCATQRVPLNRSNAIALPLAAIIFSALLFLSRLHTPVDGRIIDASISASFALLLLTLIQSDKTYPHWLAPLCRFGSGSSYSLYVVHFPLIVLLAALFLTPAHRLPPSGRLLLEYAGLGLVAIMYGYGISAITEANTSKMRRWLKSQVSQSIFHRPAP